MKRLLKSFCFSILLVSIFFIGDANAQSVEQITLFKSNIVLEENTDIQITEEIHYSFPEFKHGVIREIPIDYKVDGGFKRPTTLALDSLYYYEENFPNEIFRTYERTSSNGYAIFKIGDPESTIQGDYVYVIEYTLKNATNYFDDYDELYLNITGNGWSIPIQKAIATITLPGEITDQVCFTGATGSENTHCTMEKTSEKTLTVSVDTPLNSFEGYTVAVKMPKGTLEDTTNRQRIAFLLSNIGILLPIPVFFLLNGIYQKKGKNKKVTVIPNYKPETEMYPLLAGYIYNKTLNNKHITAEIIKLAIDGFLKIRQEGKKDYILVKLKEATEDIPSTLLTGLFKKNEEINTKKISSDFYMTVQSLNSKINKTVYEQKYFDTSRRNLKGILIAIAVVSFFIAIASFAPLSFMAAIGWSFGLIISSILVLIFALMIDIRGVIGNEIYYKLEGLKMYINTAEKKRIEFHNDPEKFKGVFETLLPYAVIFGLEKKWAKEFEDIYNEPPSWYDGNVNTFNSYLLVNSISGISQNVQSKSVSPNSSGGFTSSHGGSGGSGFSGGSSGGGFGGGGGGSW